MNQLNWQPIETAPKGEDVWIIVVSKNAPMWYMTVVSWRAYHPNAKGKLCWRDPAGIKVDENRVTHWAPLPDGPKP